MSTYKVIQDIEAEDHILGPLSLRQFIFALITLLCLYLCYLVTSKGAAFLVVLFLPPALFFGFFAIPFGRDQPTEIWALAKIRFLLKPRRRIWDQSGVKELVTVTAPKKVEEHLTNGLSENEVQSRLAALANTIDTRGWAIKNVNVNMYAQPYQQMAPAESDRLVDMSAVPQQVPDYDVQASDDILDERNNPIAQQFEQLITSSEQSHRQKLQEMMNSSTSVSTAPAKPLDSGAAKPDYWFMHEPVAPPKLAQDQAMFAPQVLMPGTDDASAPVSAPRAANPTDDEAALAAKFKQQHSQPAAAFTHMKTILPLDQQQPVAPQPQPAPPVANPATVLASDNDKNIDVIAREAKRINHQDDAADDEEVVVSLH